MGNYIVTGRAGSGKSAVTTELLRRGYNSFDTDDITGLSSWREIQTSKFVNLGDDTFIDLDTYEWIWKPHRLKEFVSDKSNVFICGGADNDLTFDEQFIKHFVLVVSPETQIERLTTRTTNDYGKNPSMHAKIIAKQAEHVSNAIAQGAIPINANQPIDQVVDEILSHCNER